MDFSDYLRLRDFRRDISLAAEEAAVDYVLDNRTDYAPQIVEACLQGWRIHMSPDDYSEDPSRVLVLSKGETNHNFTVPHQVIEKFLPDPDTILEMDKAIFAYEARMKDELHERLSNPSSDLNSSGIGAGDNLNYDEIKVLGTNHNDETVEFMLTSHKWERYMALPAHVFPSIHYRFSKEVMDLGWSL